MIFALVTHNVVINIIVADQTFINQNSQLCDVAVGFADGISYPGIGYQYNPTTGVFSPPPVDVTQGFTFSITAIDSLVEMEVVSSSGMQIGDQLQQGSISTLVVLVLDSTHITVVDTTGFVPVVPY